MNGDKPRITCAIEKRLQPHIFAGISLLTTGWRGWKQIWKCANCGAQRVWGLADFSSHGNPPSVSETIVDFKPEKFTNLVDADMRDMTITRKSLGLLQLPSRTKDDL